MLSDKVDRKVAKTLAEILHNPMVISALDKSQPLRPLLTAAIKSRDINLARRNPLPAYLEDSHNGLDYHRTDFDMFTALKAAIKYGLVVNLPSYDEMRPRVLQSNQRVISKKNRHGQIFKVISNNDMHTMSIRTKDYSVLEFGPNEKQKVGAWRHFSVVDPFAEWHQGWRSLEITPTEQLKTFFEEHKLAIPTGFVGPDGVRQQVVHFEYFVHPNLAFAFYGSPYILLKIMAQRMKDQADHYRQQARELREEGVRLPPPKEPQEVITYTQTEPGKKVVVPSIEAKVILPKVEGEDYPIYSLGEDWKPKKHEKMPDTMQNLQGVLRYAERVERELTYGIGAALRAEVRAIELAYRLHGFIKGHELEPGWEIHPGWDIPEWDREYVEPGKRIVWNALQLSDDAFLLYRARNVTTTLKSGPDYIYKESDVVLV